MSIFLKKNFTKVNLNHLAVKVLEQLGNRKPTKKQIDLVESLLVRTSIEHQMLFHHKLTVREVSCLLLAAKGKTVEETAELMKVKASTIKTWRKNLINKLSCASITEAIYVGVQYGYLAPRQE